MKKFLIIFTIMATSMLAFAQYIPEGLKQQTTLTNLVPNAGFENGRAFIENSGGTFTVQSSTVLSGKNSAAFTPNAASQYFRSTALTIPTSWQNAECILRGTYSGSNANVYVTLLNGSNTEIIATTERAVLTSAAGTKFIKIPFTCPASGSVKYAVISTASGVIGYFDDFIIEINYESQAVNTIGTEKTKYCSFLVSGVIDSSTPCTSGSCAISAQKGGCMASVTRTSQGRYTMTFTSNFWSTPTKVLCSATLDTCVSGGGLRCWGAVGGYFNSSTRTVNWDDPGSAATDASYTVMCHGQ